MKPATTPRMKPIGVPKSITLEQSESVKRYLQEIKGYSTLSRSEELDLLRRTQDGDKAAREKILKHNLKFVVSAAKRYQHSFGHTLLVDLIQLGNIGLMKAVDRYDLNSGYKFITFAVWWIRQSIMAEMDQYNAVIDLPHNFYSSSTKIRDYKSRFEQEHGYEPSADQLEDLVRPGDKRVLRHGELYTNKFVYLDKSISDLGSGGHESTYVDIIEDTNTAAPDAQLGVDDRKTVVTRLLRCLSPREKSIMEAHYGINGDDPVSTEEIAKQLEMTPVRVRQIMAKAQKKMRDTAETLDYNPYN